MLEHYLRKYNTVSRNSRNKPQQTQQTQQALKDAVAATDAAAATDATDATPAFRTACKMSRERCNRKQPSGPHSPQLPQ